MSSHTSDSEKRLELRIVLEGDDVGLLERMARDLQVEEPWRVAEAAMLCALDRARRTDEGQWALEDTLKRLADARRLRRQEVLEEMKS